MRMTATPFGYVNVSNHKPRNLLPLAEKRILIRQPIDLCSSHTSVNDAKRVPTEERERNVPGSANHSVYDETNIRICMNSCHVRSNHCANYLPVGSIMCIKKGSYHTVRIRKGVLLVQLYNTWYPRHQADNKAYIDPLSYRHILCPTVDLCTISDEHPLNSSGTTCLSMLTTPAIMRRTYIRALNQAVLDPISLLYTHPPIT